MEPSHRSASTSIQRDLIVVTAATLVVAAVSMQLELSETVYAWTRRWERFQLDEFPGIVLFAAIALTWFVWRRIREARAELGRRIVLEHELAAALAENRLLSRSIVEVQEDERRRLARELHDELGQHLNAIKIDGVSIRQCSDGKLPEAHRAAVSIIGIADYLHALVRDMTRRLRPAGLDELGLPAALEDYVEAWRSRSPQARLELNLIGDLEGLGEATNITLYRLIQEGLTNVSRHADAQRIEVRVERSASHGQPGKVTLELTDDGNGCPALHESKGLGLIGMRERVQALGGVMEIVSGAARGFEINAWLPVEEKQ